MEKIYTISEIGKLLGLSNDAIRFMKRKDWFIQISIQKTNIACIRYKMYWSYWILFITAILIFSVSDICELSKSLDPKRVYTLVEQQRKKCRKKNSL